MREKKHTIIGGALVFDMVGCTLHGSNLDVYYDDNVAGCTDFATNLVKKVTESYLKVSLHMENVLATKTDHVSFWNNGFCAVGCVENNYRKNVTYHRSYDTLDCPVGLQDARQVTEVTRMGCAILATLARPVGETGSGDEIPYSKKSPAITARSITPGSVMLAVHLPGYSGPLKVEIFDASGRRVRQEQIRNFSDDRAQLYMDAQCCSSGSGLFFVVLKTTRGQFCKKFAMVQ